MEKYPELQPILEQAKTMEEIWHQYIETLKSEGNLRCSLYANKLLELRRMLNPTYLRKLDKEFYLVKGKVASICRKYGIFATLERRQKDFIGINEKIRLFIQQSKPLELIQDLLGFRINLLTGEKDTKETIEISYKVLNELINFFVIERGCILAEASPIWDTNFNPEEHLEVVVPIKSGILEGFEAFLKDYTKNPKENGYQGFHIVVIMQDGTRFEVQIRTEAQDIRARYGSASHNLHKLNRYKDVKNWKDWNIDLSKVSIPGFAIIKQENEDVTETEFVYDKVGLCKSIDPFNRL